MKEFLILKQYLKEINRYPLLSAKEEQELGYRTQQGDEEAKKILIECNLRLVVRIALDMNRGRFPLLDVIQNGNLGLIRAAEKFDYKRNIRFSSYAAYWIRQSILRHFGKDAYLENISTRMQEKKKNNRRFIEGFFSSHSRLPSAKELAQEMNISLFEASQELLAYQPHLYEKPTCSVEDIMAKQNVEETIESQCLAEEISHLINILDEKSRSLIEMRYGFSEPTQATLSELAKQLNLSTEGVRQRENRLLMFLREKNPSLRYYLA